MAGPGLAGFPAFPGAFPPGPIFPITGLPVLVCGNLIDIVLRDRSHNSLHSLTMIDTYGVLGGPTMRNMNAAWTASRIARAKAVYRLGHADDLADAVAAGPPATTMAPLRPFPPDDILTYQIIIPAQCAPCFRFLCRYQIISPEGYDYQNRRSYLTSACGGPGATSKIPFSIIEDLPGGALVACQSRQWGGPPGVNAWPPENSIFKLVKWNPQLMRRYIARLQAVIAAVPPGSALAGPLDLSPTMDARDCFHIANWIDPATATALLGWNINFSIGQQGDTTVWQQLIESKSKYRAAMFNWMSANPHGVAGGPSVTMRCIVTGDPYYAGRGLMGSWPPLAIALLLADTVAVESLCSQPGVIIDATGSNGVFVVGMPLPPLRTVGVCGTLAMRQVNNLHNAARALKRWIILAHAEMEANGNYGHLLEILEEITKETSTTRRMIRVALPPAGMGAAQHGRLKAAQRRLVTKYAISVINTIHNMTFRTLTTDPNGNITVVRMYERPAYSAWYRQFKARRFRIDKDTTAVWHALDRHTPRILRSGMDAMDTDED